VNRQKKQEAVERLRSDMGPDSHLVLAEYRGLTVEEMTGLRKKIRSASGTLRVMKNTLVRRAVEGTGNEAVMDLLTGPNALVFTREDPVPMVKVLAEASKAKEAVKIKGGVVEGKSVTPEEILRIAELPSREVLLAMTLGSLAAPMQGLVNVCQGTIRNFVYVLDALRQAKSAEA
jgi:large subunit ribosomal protein L10